MKIEEIVEPFILDLQEMFGTEIPTTWSTDGDDNIIGRLTINDDQFKIVLERAVYKDHKFINIAFQIWDEQGQMWSEEATLDNKKASTIIGAIINAVSKELQKHEYDALVFAAGTLVDKRMRIYNKIASSYTKKFGGIRQNIPLKNGGACSLVCTKEFLNGNAVDDVIDEIASKIDK